jgi:hypothetical protein
MKTFPCLLRILVGIFVAALLGGLSVEAATLTVNNTADAGGTCPGADCTLRQAIATAGAGDTITFSLAANSTVTLTSGELLINKTLTISGPGPNALSVMRSAGATGFRLFDIGSGVTATISGLTISNGVLNGTANNHQGGGIFNAGTLTITNCTISGNSTQQTSPGNSGGGIFNGGTLTITNSTISGNTSNSATDGGGGIHNKGTLMVTNSTISGNSTNNSTPGGGGVKNEGQATITNSTISGNTMTNSSGGKGAGIYNVTGTMTVTSSTISGNNGDTGRGGGIENEATLTVVNSTISGNSTLNGFGGGIYSGGGTVNAKNTIIALNTAANNLDVDFVGTLTSQGFNVIGNDNGANITPANQTGDQVGTSANPINPMLGPLQNNGGPTFTQALLSGSTAIDAGNAGGASTDQRGFTRPVDDPAIGNASGGDGSDIGAFEVQANQLPGCKNINTVVGNTNDSGPDSLRDVIANVCAGITVTFASNVRGAITLTSSELVVNKSLSIVGPGANLLSVQRSAASATPNFRIFNIAGNFNVNISGLTIANGNAAGQLGGGIYNPGTLTLTSAAISGNTAINGGGIHNDFGTLTISSSSISGNTVSSNTLAGSGGGIFNRGGTVTLTNSTISGNSAIGPGGNSDHGGALFTNVGSVTLTHTTISANSSDNGGGVFAANGGIIKLKNTIIALNTSPSGPDVNGPLTSDGFNLIGSSAAAMITPVQFSDQIGVTATQLQLGPLQSNGGPTQTHALLSGSLALDKGNSSGSTTDQRGMIRPYDDPNIPNASGGDGSDIGAFEFSPPLTTLGNISTRGFVQTGDNVMIGGFTIAGTGNKTVLLRAIGPSLANAPFNLGGTLQDPTLGIFSGSTRIEFNDNWMDAANAASIPVNLQPTVGSESAILTSLPPGAYTAIVSGTNGGTGIGLVEVFDLDAMGASKLTNISTRGLVETGDDVMIGGFNVKGAASEKVVIRAIGPSLASPPFNIANALQNPTLSLFNDQGTRIQFNDDWRSDQEADIIATGLQPSDNAESVIVSTLLPGNYTAIVNGVNGTTGVALVEVYAAN